MKFREALNIAIINLIVFFALIAIHELSHSFTGIALGCKYDRAVLMDSNFMGPYTEMFCPDGNYVGLFLSSLVVTSLFSGMFLFLKAPSRNLFLVSMGLSIVFSALDLSVVSFFQSTFYPIVTFGLALTTVGEYSIASGFVNRKFSLDLFDIEREVLEVVEV